MKKLIPVLIAIALICVVVAVNFGSMFKQKYSYGEDYADLNEYFKTTEADDVPIIMGLERIDECAKCFDGNVYFAKDMVEDYLTCRFYYDSNENLLLYTTATNTISSDVGSKSYTENGETKDVAYTISIAKGDTLYIAADYIKKFVNFSYEFFEEPYRMQLHTSWGQKTVAGIKKDTQIRWKGGVKSEILRDVYEGEVVEIIEVMDDWTKVKTDDAFIGYVPNSTLEESSVMNEKPVTDVPEEEFVSLNENKRINLTWHNIEYAQDGASLYNVCAYIQEVNVISPTWYWLTDNEGNFSSIATPDYVQAAHSMGMEVWPLVANFHTGTDVDLTEVLSYTSKRTALVEKLVNETVTYGCEGINVDFEQVPPACADHYIQFIRELAVAGHKKGLVISVDNYVPTEYTAYYNRKEQGKFVDYIIIMGYDEHYAGSEIGSVSSISWMKEGIENTLKVVPKEKVINAIPFYTRVWKTSNGETISEAVDMKTANQFLKNHKITTVYDEATNQNYGECTEDGVLFQVWMEDADSIRTRLNVMTTYDIAGVASWRLGNETRDIWDIIAAYMKN